MKVLSGIKTSTGGLFSVPHGFSRPTAWYDPHAAFSQTLTATNTLSSLTDVTKQSSAATQGTAANQPLLSGASNEENLVPNTTNFTGWTNAALASSNLVADPSGGTEAIRLVENTANSTHGIQPSSLYQSTLFAGVGYRIRAKVRGGGRNVAVYAADTAFGLGSVINTTNGTIAATYTTGGTTTSELVTDLGDGWYLYTATVTPTTTKTSVQIDAFLASGTTLSYLGDGTSYVELYRPQIAIGTSSNVDVPTTTYPIVAGIGGNKVGVYGGDDSLGTSIAVNPTGGLAGIVVVRPNVVAGTYSLYGARNNDATDRLRLIISAGFVGVAVMNGSANYIGRQKAAAAAANTNYIYSFLYNGGTASSDVKLYSGTTQIDDANFQSGAYTLPTAGASLVLGAEIGGAATLLNGSLGAALFWNNGAPTEAQLMDWVRFLGARFGIAV